MEKLPQFEQPSKEELTQEIERHMELIRSWTEEGQMADQLWVNHKEELKAKIAAEWKVVEEKQKLLETAN